jgi:hypothetical protein
MKLSKAQAEALERVLNRAFVGLAAMAKALQTPDGNEVYLYAQGKDDPIELMAWYPVGEFSGLRDLPVGPFIAALSVLDPGVEMFWDGSHQEHPLGMVEGRWVLRTSRRRHSGPNLLDLLAEALIQIGEETEA